MTKGTLQIDSLGTSFSIQSEEKSEYLEVLYEYFKKTIKQIEQNTGITDPIKIAILANIQIIDELYKEKIKTRDQNKQIDLAEAEQLALNMIYSIDKVIK